VPLHPNQQAYQAGKSLETALKQLVVQVEKVLDQQESLGVFLDVEGAYNNTSYDSICAALVKLGVDHTIVQCINATQEGCLTVVTQWIFQEGCSIQRCVVTASVVLGC